MATYHLHCWSIGSRYDNNPNAAPGQQRRSLFGKRAEDDKEIITSYIVKVDGKNVTTYSGSVYILEDIDPTYLAWMTEHGYTYDPENPIKIIEPKWELDKSLN